MVGPDGKHVFISYVHENDDEVNRLCKVLEAAKIPYWRDRNSLAPGDAWKAKIREAIQSGSLVFLACFSDQSRARDKSHMNEELTIAVEEYRKMPPGRTWLIPVRFDDGDLPAWDLGAGRSLSDLNQVDMFGDDYAANGVSLATTIHNLMGDKQLGPASTLAAVEQATAADRADLLTRLTKEMLPDPGRRIELDDLIAQEVQRVVAVVNDPERVSGKGVGGSTNEQIASIVTAAQDLWALTEPFCASLRVAARWGSPETLDPWRNGIQSFAASGSALRSGNSALIELGHLPAMVSIMTAGLATASNRKWNNLKTLVVDPTVRDRYQGQQQPILHGTSPWSAFGNEWVAHGLARATIQGIEPLQALEDFDNRRVTKFYTPVGEWLHHVLRPLFVDQWPQDEMFAMELDRAEIMLGLLDQDLVNLRNEAAPDGRKYGRAHWFGRTTYRVHHSHGNPLEDFAQELTMQQQAWGPLGGGLFGGDVARAEAAVENFAETFASIAQNRW